jgi:hypothetical protein
MHINCIFSEKKNEYSVNDCFHDLVSVMKNQQKQFKLVPKV